MGVTKDGNLKVISLLITVAIFFTSGNLKAQKFPSAFEHIDVLLSYQQNVNQNYFHDYWSPDPAFQLELDTPFYAGNFFLSGRFNSVRHKTNEVPGFDNIQVTVGWGLRHEVVERVKIGGTVGTLFSMMAFNYVSDEQRDFAGTHFGSTSPESEIGLVFGADISYEFSGGWGIRVNWNRDIVYTQTKMKLNYIGIGLYRKFNTPIWLQEVLH
ncbi:MAG: hypothetical protein WD016_01955 [Balneolaceae bacterium]